MGIGLLNQCLPAQGLGGRGLQGFWCDTLQIGRPPAREIRTGTRAGYVPGTAAVDIEYKAGSKVRTPMRASSP